jgi:transcription elongation factor GreB
VIELGFAGWNSHEPGAGQGMISWISPLARALLKAREGDTVRFASPGGLRDPYIVQICY